MDTLTDRLERLAELQKKNIEPLQSLGSSAFVAFERMARKNYELMGDMVDYAVAQSRGSLEPTTPQALYERQMTEARAFAERMSVRTAEYVALAEQLRDGAMPDAMSEAVPTTGGKNGVVAPRATRAAPPAGTSTGTPADAVSAKSGSGTEGTVTGKAAATKKAPAKRASGTTGTTKKAAAKKRAAAAKGTTKKTASKKTTAKRSAAASGSKKRATAKKTTSKKAAAKKGGTRRA